jgi:hypothetical protein
MSLLPLPFSRNAAEVPPSIKNFNNIVNSPIKISCRSVPLNFHANNRYRSGQAALAKELADLVVIKAEEEKRELPLKMRWSG